MEAITESDIDKIVADFEVDNFAGVKDGLENLNLESGSRRLALEAQTMHSLQFDVPTRRRVERERACQRVSANPQ